MEGGAGRPDCFFRGWKPWLCLSNRVINSEVRVRKNYRSNIKNLPVGDNGACKSGI